MAYIGNTPAENYVSIAAQHFTVSATTSYSLNRSVTNETELALFINNVRQQPGSSYSYTATGTTLTLSAATLATDTMYCIFLGKSVGTIAPPDGSVGTSTLATGAVTADKIADGTVVASELANDAVTTDKIANTAVTDAKISAVATSKLTGTVNNAQIADLDAAKLTGSIADARVPASAVTQHVSTELGFLNVSNWADSAVKTVNLSTAASAVGKAQVSIFQEFSAANQTNASWDVSTNDTGFNLINSAYAQTITPAATTGSSVAFTLGSGSWATTDIGKRIVNVSTSEAGEARIISISSAVATCIITTTFTDTNAIASGDWKLFSAEFASGTFALSNATVTGGTGFSVGTAADPINTEGKSLWQNSVTALSATKAICAFNDDGGGTVGKACVLTISGTTVTAGALFTFEGTQCNGVTLQAVSSTAAILVWSSLANSYELRACVLTQSGTTVSKGSNLSIDTNGSFSTGYWGLSRIPGTSKVFLSYYKSNAIRSVILTQSGTSVSKSSDSNVYNSVASHYNDCVCLTSSLAIVVWRCDSSDFLAQLVDIGTASWPQNTGSTFTIASYMPKGLFVERLTNTTALVGWTGNSRSRLKVLSISGTTISAPGSEVEVVVNSSNVAVTWQGDGENAPAESVVGVSDNRVCLLYTGNPGTGISKLMRIITASGTTITAGVQNNLGLVGGNNNYVALSMLDSEKFIMTSPRPADSEGIANVVTNESPAYVVNQYVTTISGTDSVDTAYYSDWNSNTITETINGQSTYYAFSVNSTPSAAEVTGGTFMIVGGSQTTTRNIVSSLSSVHGGTAGVWYKNTNTTYGSETWAAATTNEAKAAIQEATAVTANQMDGTAFAAISDANLPAFGTQLSLAMTLYSTDSTVTPTIDGVSFNYDGNVINRLETDAYTIEMPSAGRVDVTAPSSGGPRNARIYIS